MTNTPIRPAEDQGDRPDDAGPRAPERGGCAVVLVAPQLGENIGSAARAIANFGLTDLRLVSPRDGWPNPRADAMAAGAFEEGGVRASVFGSVTEAVSDCGYVLAATARRRELEKPAFGPEEATGRLLAHERAGARTAVLFGAEQSGLTTDDVNVADAIVSYPVSPAFSSLNLAQAVVVFAYERARQIAAGAAPAAFDGQLSDPATKGEVDGLLGHLFDELVNAGYFWPLHKTELMKRNIAAGFTRTPLTSQEVRTLRGAVKALVEGPRRRAREAQAADEAGEA